MRTVGLKVFKNKLSEYVRFATNGETVLVTDRDRVVAEFIPPRTPQEASTAEASWAELVRAGDHYAGCQPEESSSEAHSYHDA